MMEVRDVINVCRMTEPLWLMLLSEYSAAIIVPLFNHGKLEIGLYD